MAESVIAANGPVTVNVVPFATAKLGRWNSVAAVEISTEESTDTVNALSAALVSCGVKASRLAAESARVTIWPGSTENPGKVSKEINCASVRLALADRTALLACDAKIVPATDSRPSAWS